MTLSLIARDASGAFGMVISSSSPAVASRCLHLRAGVGAVASQNITNPALGPAILDLMEQGLGAANASAVASAQDAYFDYRQVTAIDVDGQMAVHSGAQALGIFGSHSGAACIAAGNLLAGEDVLPAMVEGYEEAGGAFEERLLAGFAAAVARGGEAGPLRSAGLAVVDDVSWRVTDLRVDDHEDPLGELSRLVALWLPQKSAYRTRALDPTAAPSYGVPGDE